MSALPPKADIGTQRRDVRFAPKADILRCGRDRRYSITSSAIASSPGGTVRGPLLRRRERSAERSEVLSRLAVFNFFLRRGDLAHDFWPVFGAGVRNPAIARVADRRAEHASIGGLQIRGKRNESAGKHFRGA